MQNDSTPLQLFDRPGRYQIRVWGTLDEHWKSELHDFKISVTHPKDQASITRITGRLADQTALTGLLDLLNDLGMVILTVKRLESKPKQQASP